ncbi:MAG TPA: HEPN domain-containing protein [bacterium]|jgi:hypothetical protein
MIVRSYIKKNLEELDKLYSHETNTKRLKFHSKLALLELCGWIEESMDDIVERCIIRKIKDSNMRNELRKEIVEKTYGFEWKKHFQKMLGNVIGAINIEKLDRKMDSAKIETLKGKLETLKKLRNRYAHTHIGGTTLHYDAPSKILRDFQEIYEGLKELDNALRDMKL